MDEPRSTRADDVAHAAVYVVAYLEVMPSSTGEAAALLRQYREARRRGTGCLQLEVLQQRGRPDHFEVVEQWQDLQAFEAHGTAAHTRRFREVFQPMSGSLYDERLYDALD